MVYRVGKTIWNRFITWIKLITNQSPVVKKSLYEWNRERLSSYDLEYAVRYVSADGLSLTETVPYPPDCRPLRRMLRLDSKPILQENSELPVPLVFRSYRFEYYLMSNNLRLYIYREVL